MLLGDMSPYIFRTRDYGKTWTRIVNGIKANDYVHAVREDPVRKGLLYAGTQHGFYLSFNDGDSWLPFNQGLPDTPIVDVWVTDNDIALTAHGRSFYVLDNIATLRQYGTITTTDVQLYTPAETIRGQSPARIDYFLKEQPKSLTLDILDGKGQVVRSFAGEPPPKPGPDGKPAPAPEPGPRGPARTAPMAAGLNRFTWDLNSQPVVSFPGMILWGATQNGPMVLPGTYRVRLAVDGTPHTQSFAVIKHPLRNVSDADLLYQYELASRIRDKVDEANHAVIRIRRMKSEIAERTKDADNEVKRAAERVTKSLSAVEETVYQVRNQSNQDPLNFPIKINNRFASLLRVATLGEGRPTGNVEPIFNDIIAELKVETDRLQEVVATELPPLNRMLLRIKKEPISGK
jgi:hypothetical protein